MANLTAAIVYDEDFPLLMPKWGYVSAAFVLFIIGFFGFFLNLMVILLMMKDRQLWTPLNMILFNLVCSDFCVSIMGNPLTLISALYHQWVFGKTMCMLYGFFMALLGISSITSLTVLSFERYMMVTRPLTTQHRSNTKTCLMIAGIWTYALMLTTPPLFGWGNYINEAANISCSVNWHEQSTNTLSYILFLFAFGQMVPFSIISFSYINILRTVKRNSKRMGQVGRAENKVTMMVLVMIIAFAVAWTPYSVFALMEQFAASGIISPGLGVIPALVAKSSICYDPLIYIGMNTQFRQSIAKLFDGISKGITSQAENRLDRTVSPAQRMGRLAGRNSNKSSASTSTKKHVTFIDKKVSCSGCTNISIEEFISDITVENLRDVKNQNDSPGLTIVEPERLIFRKPLGVFTNKGSELTVENMRKDQLLMGERQSSTLGLAASCSSSLVEASSRQIEHSFSFDAISESVIESDSESKFIKRYSFKNNLTDFKSSDNIMADE